MRRHGVSSHRRLVALWVRRPGGTTGVLYDCIYVRSAGRPVAVGADQSGVARMGDRILLGLTRSIPVQNT
jgi:hypothetical protein